MQLGRYQILREIARSNDVVYEARDPQMNRRVAVKELALSAGADGAARRERIERFYREARAAGALAHPNILTIHEVGEDRGRHFIAMEFLEGHSLRERLNTGGALPPAEAVRIASALCDALEYAHTRGVIHRDIKPDNIHLLPDGRVKLTDFGIARILHETSLTIAGQVFGTPSYMAPEQIRGGLVDARTDIFSLGIVLFEMLSGRKPFTGDRVETVTYRILTEPTPPLTGAPPALDAAVRRATEKDPERRFPGAAALRDALRGAPAHNADLDRTVAGAPAGLPGAALQRTIAFAAPHASPVPHLPPAPTPSPPPPDPGNDRRRRGVAIAAGAVVTLAAVAAAGLALSRATHNAGLQMTSQQADARLRTAIERYQARDWARAAVLFEEVRRNGRGSDTTLKKARDGEAFCYRELGHEAQRAERFADAARWYRLALDLLPDDPDAKKEYDAAMQVAQSRGEPLPAPSPEPDRTTRWPRAPRADTPSVGTGDFQKANQNAAQEAERLLREGDTAQQRGDLSGARDLWNRAVAAGPGSAAALAAGERLTQNGQNVFGR